MEHIVIHQYKASDGQIFDNISDCKEHEAKIAEDMYKSARSLCNTLWNKYNPNYTGAVAELPDNRIYLAYEWLKADIPFLVVNSELKPTLNEIKEEIKKYENGETHYAKIDWERIESRISVISDWYTSIKTIKYTDISYMIEYSLSSFDLKELAALHKNRTCRKAIENLLTYCNFHSDCSKFIQHQYNEYLSA